MKKPAAYLEVRKVSDAETGALMLALVAASDADRAHLGSMKLKPGDTLRAELSKPRNVKFHRMVHALGQIVADNVESFAGMDAHSSIKRLQREAGIFCDEQEIEIPAIGKLIARIPKSLAFDSMDESQFKQLWEGICAHIVAKYWPTMNEQSINDMIGVMPDAA